MRDCLLTRSMSAHGRLGQWKKKKKKLVQAAYFVRYAHEMNGVWFPWAQRPTEYRAGFAAVAGWFRAASCGAMMVWAPNWRALQSAMCRTSAGSSLGLVPAGSAVVVPALRRVTLVPCDLPRRHDGHWPLEGTFVWPG